MKSTGCLKHPILSVVLAGVILAAGASTAGAGCGSCDSCGTCGPEQVEGVVVIPDATECDVSGDAVTGAAAELAKRGMTMEAVRVIDEAAEIQRKQHAGTPYSVGPLVWAARSLRDMDRPMSALVRYQSILGRLVATPDPAWEAIVHEDIAGVQASLGMNEKAYASYAKAMRLFESTGNKEAVRRISLKMPELVK
ncbi:hypothetical protein KBA41_14380 [Candidatus Ozemobacteraceae bacterium]|nr:hypothetical protein [Candidatus Ozemobacteraceae bacterium]